MNLYRRTLAVGIAIKLLNLMQSLVKEEERYEREYHS
jgi:hypothetical protein